MTTDVKALAQQGVAMAAVNTQVAANNESSGKIEDILRSITPKLAQASLANMKPEFLVSTAMTLLRNNEQLREADPLSVVHCVVQAAQTGLRLDPVLQQAAFVVRWNNQRKRKEAQFMPMYKGLLLLSRRSGKLQHVAAQPVYDCDEFAYGYGNEQFLRHIPSLKRTGKDAKITHYYAYAKLVGGGFQFEVMNQEEIDEVKEFALTDKKNKEASPWTKDPVPMALKTVLRRLLKLLPVEDPMLQAAIQADEMLDRGQPQQHEIVNGLVVPAVVAEPEDLAGEVVEEQKALPAPKADPPKPAAPAEREGAVWTRDAIAAIDALGKKGKKSEAQEWGITARKKLEEGSILQFDFDAIIAAYRTAFPEPKPEPKVEPEKPKARKKKNVDVAAEIEARILDSDKASILFTLKSQIGKAAIEEDRRKELLSLLNDKLAEITRKK